MADKNMVTIEQITVDGIVYTSTRPGYYYKKVNGKQTRIPKTEWEQAVEKFNKIKEEEEAKILPEGFRVESTWDGDTYSFALYRGEEFIGRYWDGKEAVEQAKKLAEADKEAEDAVNNKKTKKEEKLNAEMEKLGYHRIDSAWNDIRYTTEAHEVMAWNTVEEGLKWVKEQTKGQKTKKTRRSKDIAYDGHGITLTAKQVDFIRHIPDTDFYEHGLESAPWCDVLADQIGGQFARKPMTVGAMISTLREKNVINVGMERMNGKKAKYFVFTELGKKVAQELGLN